MRSNVEIKLPSRPIPKELTLEDVPPGSFFTAESVDGTHVRLYQRIRGSDGSDLTYRSGGLQGRFLDLTDGTAWAIPYKKNIRLVDVEIIVKEQS